MIKFQTIIDRNIKKYIKKSTKKIDSTSLSYLYDKKVSQSINIKMGLYLEKIFKDIILDENSELKNINERKVGGKQTVLFFLLILEH